MIGHDQVRAVLEKRLPRAALFLGPQSVGKWTLAEHLARRHGVLPQDVIRLRYLSSDTTEIVSRISSLSAAGGFRVVIARIDSASPASMNALLKSLEDAQRTRFILISSDTAPETVSSRCEVFRFSLLSDDQVATILTGRGFSPGEAKKLSKEAGGQVRVALALSTGVDDRGVVVQAMRSIMERDQDFLDSLAVRWSDEATGLMATACREAITGRWRVFSDAELGGVGKRVPMQVLAAINPKVRPRLVVRAGLMSVLRSRS